MEKFKKLNLWLLVLLVGVSACRENLDLTNTDEETPDPVVILPFEPIINNVNASLTGQVVDENEAPVAGAMVQWVTKAP
ncbi:MAG: hypothetical protein HC880_07670 [Bacteroidia bacterium]|nr:hypothetical protein [Bacteroidia bacterium]